MNIIIIGAGLMAQEYARVLQGLDKSFQVVGRSEAGIIKFKEKFPAIDCHWGGIEAYLANNPIPTHAIVAVDVANLFKTASFILRSGIKNILLEKPGAMSMIDLDELIRLKNDKKAFVAIAYNRRFYQSVQKARELIKEDGGVTACFFEFTEWVDRISEDKFPPDVLKHWILANSSHVIDLAFHFCGSPVNLSSTVSGKAVSWHPAGSCFAGSGDTDTGICFSYLSNWDAPGRWSVEVLTKNRRFYFKPMEQLHIQQRNKVVVDKLEMDYSLDLDFKPGLFDQVKAFLAPKETDPFCFLEEHKKHFAAYLKIAGYNNTPS